MLGASGRIARTAPATVFGMSWSFKSRKTGRPFPARRATPVGPFAAKNSSPSLMPPTAPVSASAKRSAAARSGVSMAQ